MEKKKEEIFDIKIITIDDWKRSGYKIIIDDLCFMKKPKIISINILFIFRAKLSKFNQMNLR